MNFLENADQRHDLHAGVAQFAEDFAHGGVADAFARAEDAVDVLAANDVGEVADLAQHPHLADGLVIVVVDQTREFHVLGAEGLEEPCLQLIKRAGHDERHAFALIPQRAQQEHVMNEDGEVNNHHT